jgi:hypothetical protein
MATNILEKFDELFGDVDHIDPTKIEQFVHESLKFFDYLRQELQSSEEERRKAAFEIAMELQKRLENFAEKALKKTGMSKEQLHQFISMPGNFAPQEWNALKNSEKEIKDFQQGIPSQSSNDPERKKKIKPQKI